MYFISVYGLFSYFIVTFGNQICEETCKETFLSSNQEEELDSCFRGCRFFSINDLLTSSLNLDAISICEHDCIEAYADKDKQLACDVGCKSQSNYSSSINQYKEESDLDMHLLQWHIQIFQPMMIFRQIISRASVDESFLRQPVNDDSRSYTLVLQLSDNFVEPGDISNEVELKNVGLHQGEEILSVSKYTSDVYMHGRNWLSCVEKNTGIPRWLLLPLVVSAFVTSAWMCLQICKGDNKDEKSSKKYTFDEELFVPYAEHNQQLYFISKSNDAGPIPEKVPLLA